MFIDMPCKYLHGLKSKKNSSLNNIADYVVDHVWMYIPLELFYECEL